jgi:hypothetical protein
MAQTAHFRIAASPRDLQTLTDDDWVCGVRRDALRDLEQWSVATRNTTYHVIVLDPHSGEVLVRGGDQFPQFTRARLGGGSPAGFDLSAMTPGFTMEFLHEGRRTITTRVRGVTPVPPDERL